MKYYAGDENLSKVLYFCRIANRRRWSVGLQTWTKGPIGPLDFLPGKSQSLPMKKQILISLFPLLFTACASTQLKPGAESVIVSESAPPADCKEIGTAESNTVVNVAHTTQNVITNLLRNRAYEIGGNYVQLNVGTTLKNQGRVFKCP